MKKFLLLGLLVAAANAPAWAAKCTGAANCRVCKDCSRCKHCSVEGKVCGVCRPAAAKKVTKKAPTPRKKR